MEKIEEIYYHKCKNGTEAHIVLKRDPKTGKMVFKECNYSLYGKYSLKEWSDLGELSAFISALCIEVPDGATILRCKEIKDNVKKSHKVGTIQRKTVKKGVNNQKK